MLLVLVLVLVLLLLARAEPLLAGVIWAAAGLLELAACMVI